MEHFDGMFTVNLPTNILPLFPSWSLIIIGSSNLYNPLKGVEQIGFFSGSNFLLLWEIPAKLSELISFNDHHDENSALKDVTSQEEQWPAPGEITKISTVASVNNPISHIPFYQTVNQVSTQTLEVLQNERSKMKRAQIKDSITIKAYIGNEYECPRGHR